MRAPTYARVATDGELHGSSQIGIHPPRFLRSLDVAVRVPSAGCRLPAANRPIARARGRAARLMGRVSSRPKCAHCRTPLTPTVTGQHGTDRWRRYTASRAVDARLAPPAASLCSPAAPIVIILICRARREGMEWVSSWRRASRACVPAAGAVRFSGFSLIPCVETELYSPRLGVPPPPIEVTFATASLSQSNAPPSF